MICTWAHLIPNVLHLENYRVLCSVVLGTWQDYEHHRVRPLIVSWGRTCWVNSLWIKFILTWRAARFLLFKKPNCFLTLCHLSFQNKEETERKKCSFKTRTWNISNIPTNLLWEGKLKKGSLVMLWIHHLLALKSYSAQVSQAALVVKKQKTKNPPANAGDVGDAGSISRLGQSPGGGSSILAWRIPWTKEPSGLQSIGCKSLHTTEAT